MKLRKLLRRIRLQGRWFFRSRRRRRQALAAAIGLVVLAVLLALNPPEAPKPPPLAESPPSYRILLSKYAARSNLPETFVDTVVLAESSRNPRAVSRVNAKGLMQIMPAAETDVLKKLRRRDRYRNLEKGDLFDSEYNLLIGTTYLRMLADRFDGDAYTVLAAYHMGQTRVAGFRRANPGITGKELVAKFAGPQTKAYCHRILQGNELQLPMRDRQPEPLPQPVSQPLSRPLSRPETQQN